MSVTLTGNPLIVAAADASAAVIVSNHFRVQAIIWDVGSAGADNSAIIIQDKLGVVKFAYTINLVTSGAASAPPVIFPVPVHFNGLIIPTLSAGTVYIYLADSNDLRA